MANGEWDEAERYAAALQHYTQAEPLPWSDFFIARGRALTLYHRGIRTPEMMKNLRQLCKEAEHVGLYWALPALKAILSARNGSLANGR